MAFSYERYDRQQRRGRAPTSQRTALGYWIPLGLTIATATVGFATWIWKERNSAEDAGDDDGSYIDDDESLEQRTNVEELSEQRAHASSKGQSEVEQFPSDDRLTDQTANTRPDQETIVTRMSGAIRRTPSPQQIFDGASKRVAAGVAAASAIVGRGLTSIRESDDDFPDHELWSAETEPREQPSTSIGATESHARSTDRQIPQQATGKKKVVAVVVSGDLTSPTWEDSGHGYAVEPASIVSHLPKDINHELVELAVLIYAPQLQSYPLDSSIAPRQTNRTGSSAASSYSNISYPGAEEDAALDMDNGNSGTPSAYYNSLQISALQVVQHPTQIVPFTTPTGHVQLLRFLSPSLVYIEESLSGVDGQNVREIENWVGQIVIVIGGQGLVDTETEDEGAGNERGRDWWKDSSRIGLGKAEIVESSRVTEDWEKRIG